MKSRKLYTTFEEKKLYRELDKKYIVEIHTLSGHTPEKLYSFDPDKQSSGLPMRIKKRKRLQKR